MAVSLLFSVLLNHLFAINRARDDRERSIRDRHFEQLRPTLRHEADQLMGLAQEIRLNARLDTVNVDTTAKRSALNAHFWPDLMSHDLGNHFPDYQATKQKVAEDVAVLDMLVSSAVLKVESLVNLGDAHREWKKTIAVSKLAACSGHGDGIVLRVAERDSSFNFSYFRGGAGGNGPPPTEYLEVFHAYDQLMLDAASLSMCEQVKQRAKAILDAISELANAATLLSNHAVLPGHCEFMDSPGN